MPYTLVTLGGVAVGVSIIILFGIRWWFREKHRPAALIPFLLAQAYGMLAALSAGYAWSALGAAAWITLWAANVAGYAALVWGVGGQSSNVTRGAQIVLTSGGFVIVLLLTVVLIGLWKWATKVPNWKLAAGFASGVCLALSGNVAGVAAVPLGSAVNLLGSGFTGVFS